MTAPQVFTQGSHSALIAAAVTNEFCADCQVLFQSRRNEWGLRLVRQEAGAVKSNLACIERGCQCMIRADGAKGCYPKTVFFCRAGKNVLEFADLVAAVNTASDDCRT